MDETRERILEAAHAVFSNNGFRGATTRRIAARAGVNEVTLFRLFACKDELLREAIGHQADRAAAALAAPGLPARPADLRRELSSYLLATFSGFYQGRQSVRTAMAEWSQHAALQEPLLRTSRHVFNELRSYLKAAQVEGLVRSDLGVTVMAQTVIAAVFADGLLRDMLPERFPLEPGASIHAYLDVLLDGLVPSAQKGTPE